MVDIRKRVNDLCKTRGMTQKDLAERMGITREALALSLCPNRKTKKGNQVSYPSMDTLVRIASALNIEVEDIFISGNKTDTVVCPHCGKPISIGLTINSANQKP